jgi:hypothetical protein
MSDIANKLICLSLNKSWQPTIMMTVKDAIIKLCGSQFQPKPSAMALDIDYALDDNGEPDFSNVIKMNPVNWNEWIKLPIRNWDLSINSPNSKIRVPTVIVSLRYNKMPVKMFHGVPSKESIWMRDGGVCQYTGKQLKKIDGNIDHVVPRSRGGKDTWENMVLSNRELNIKKGNRLNEEVGIKLIKQPKAPKPIYAYELIKDAKHQDWEHFLIK